MLKQDSNKHILYFVYVRKSTEPKERQALSIPAQIDKIRERFPDLDMEIVEESRSAFVPHNRPVFEGMLANVKAGARRGLIAWHPDRLSRNELDAATITYLVRTGVIADLKFGTYTFENTPEGIMLLQMALSQSQYESAKKGRDVVRGLQKKAELGIYPAPAPTCYVNVVDPQTKLKVVEPDAERFRLCRKMVELMLSGNHTVPQILKIANEEWGFRTRPSKNCPQGRPLCRSTIYYILTRPFYYGEFEYPVGSNTWHKGTHLPLMNEREHERIQALLGRRRAHRRKKRPFAYRGSIRCGECGAMVTAEEKVKRQQNGNVHFYTYYHCTKRKNPQCSQPSIEERELERQILSCLTRISIPAEFHTWGIGRLTADGEQDREDAEQIRARNKREYDECDTRLRRLLDMREADEITREEYMGRRRELEKRKARLKCLTENMVDEPNAWLKEAERLFDFAEKARAEFANGSPERKKKIFSSLGSNLTLREKKLFIDMEKELFPVQTLANAVRHIHDRFEPRGYAVNSGYFERFYPESPRLLQALDTVRTCLTKLASQKLLSDRQEIRT